MITLFDFFNCYVMGGAQALTGFYFFNRLLKQRIKARYYVLFGLLWLLMMIVIPGGRIAELLSFILLLTVSGVYISASRHCFFYRETGVRVQSRTEDGLDGWRMPSGCSAGRKRQAYLAVFLYAALTEEIMQLCYGVVNSLLSILYPLMSAFDQKAVGICFMILGNMALVPAVFCYRAACRYFSWYETVEKQYACLVLIPILMIFFIEEYVSSVMYDLDLSVGGISVSAYRWPLLVIRLFGLASLFCLMSAYKNLLENFRLSREVSLLEQEEQFLSQYVEEAKARYDETRSFRHDIKNHITVLKELLLNGKKEQAVSYLKDMEEMAEGLSFPCSTNNPVVDILIGNKLGIAESLGIRVSCRLTLPYPGPVRDIDFCVILSNALDNGIRACRETDEDGDRYISVTGCMQGDLFLIEIENSFSGSGSFKEGTGLTNIKATAEKYHGAVSIKTEGKVFLLSVLLIIPQQPESISLQNG